MLRVHVPQALASFVSMITHTMQSYHSDSITEELAGMRANVDKFQKTLPISLSAIVTPEPALQTKLVTTYL